MPPIARLVPVAALVVLLATGCADTSDEPPGAAPPPDSASSAPPSPSASPTPAAREPHILVLTATGNARVTSFTYLLDGKSTKVDGVKLPWRMSVDVPADGLRHEWRVVVEHGAGNMEVRAIFNGNVVGTARGGGSGTGTVSTSGWVLG
jgi:hypothetical protein